MDRSECGTWRRWCAAAIVAGAVLAPGGRATTTTTPIAGVTPAQLPSLREAAGQLLWTSAGTGRRITVFTRPVAGGPVRTLGSVSGPVLPKGQAAGSAPTVVPVFDGTNYAVSVVGDAYVKATAPGPDCEGECEADTSTRQELIVGSLLGAPPRVVLDCEVHEPPSSRNALSAAIAAGRTFFAGARCGAPAGVDALGADGTVTVADATGTVPLAGRGAWLAYPVGATKPGATPTATKVLDLAGAGSYTAAGAPDPYAADPASPAAALLLQDDGTLVAGGRAFAPGQPQGTPVRGPGRYDDLLSLDSGTLLVGGARGLRRYPLAGGAPQAFGLPGLSLLSVLADHAGQADLAASTCAGRVVRVSALMPGRAAGRVDGCPVTVSDATARLSATRVVRIPVSCPNGCAGRLSIGDEEDTFTRTVAVRLAAGGRGHVSVRLSRRLVRGRSHVLYVDSPSPWLRTTTTSLTWRR